MPKDATAWPLPLTVRLQPVAAKMVFVAVAEEVLTPPYAASPSAARALVPVTVRFVADATTEVSVVLMSAQNEEAMPMHATLLAPAEMMLQLETAMAVPKAKTLDLLPYETIPMETTACLPLVLMMLCEATTTVTEADIFTDSPIEANPMEARQ